MNSGGTQKKHMSGLFYLFFFSHGQWPWNPGSPSLFNGRSCCNLLTFDDFFPKFDHRPWMKSLCRRWIDGRFLVDKNLKKKKKQIRYSGKNGNTPKYQKKEPRIISFTYLMSFKLGSSMVPHGKQFSSTHCLGPIQGLISMADAGSRDKSGWWLSPTYSIPNCFWKKS